MCQFAEIPGERHLESAEYADIEVPAAHHREGSSVIEIGRARVSVTGILPALIKSGSMSAPYACGPTPNIPFSLCKITALPGMRKSATLVGWPIPRFTYEPGGISAATSRARSSRPSGRARSNTGRRGHPAAPPRPAGVTPAIWTMRSTKIPGVITASGSISPG